MTVSQIHNYMTEKVIPESVMPQNIAACLMDEEATIPELDAFTFLNRVRALGIGSADFLYLLKGCDAPQKAIEKIESNPAMNLQSLIVTLENSGLTSQDYTRMLYTARQIWERTLTMRLEKKQTEVEEDYDLDDLPDPDEQTQEEQNVEEYTDRAAEAILTARQKPKKAGAPEVMTARQKPKDEEKSDIVTARQVAKGDYVGRQEYDDYYDEDKPVACHSGKIAVSAVFAALLLGLSAAMSVFGFEPTLSSQEDSLGYAADSMDIFAQVHAAYTGNFSKADVQTYRDIGCEVFGNLLVYEPDGLGAYELGKRVFSAEADAITVYEADGNAVVQVCELLPPEGAEFVEIVEGKDMLAAVYMADDSAGIVAYNADGQTLYVAEQCGVLTDIYVGAQEISLGTVYTPAFRQSFTVEQTQFYLPQFALDGQIDEMLPTEIIMSDTDGCSYAVYGSFKLSDGTLSERAAALGAAEFSGAEDFFAVMRDEDGCRLVGKGTDEQPVAVKQAGNVIACDIGDTVIVELSEDTQPYDSVVEVEREQHIVATAQTDENGTSVYLHGFDLEPVAVITNIDGEVKSLHMEDGILYIMGTDGLLMAADISMPATPAIKQLTTAYGVVKGEYALCANASGTLVKLTLYREDEGGVAEAASSTKVVTLAQGSDVSFERGNTFYIGEDRYGAAYSYFDGVSRISEYSVFGRTKATQSLFDKGDGFICAAELDGALYLIYGNEAVKIN